MKSRKLQSFFFILSSVRRALGCNASTLVLRSRDNYEWILYKLCINGFIQSYEFFKRPKTSQIFVLLRLGKFTNKLLKPAIEVSRARGLHRHQYSISNRSLKRLLCREGIAVLYFLNTDKGIITGHEAIRSSRGGKLLARVG